MKINSSYGIYDLYNSMFQNSVSLNNNKLYKSLFQTDKTKNQQAFGENALQYVNNIKSSSKSLGKSLDSLSGAAFSTKTMSSSDNDVLTVNYFGSKPDSVGSMTVNVKQTASGQVNEGARMTADAAFGDSGINKFSIEIGDKATQLSVNVSSKDTNKDVQQKMADAINNAGLGVKATVETDSKNNTSMLKLEASGTGDDAKNKFTLKDTTGNLVEKTGANDVKQNARNAIYSVNGGSELSSMSNTVYLSDGLNLTFNKASDKDVTIAPSRDTNRAKSAVEDFVKNYNDLYSEAAQKLDDPKAQNLATKMVNISKIYSGSLANVGIGFDKDGKMTIDKERLDTAAENGKLETFFTQNKGKNYGFTNQLSNLADSVSRNTSNYVSSSVLGNSLMENFGYTGYGKPTQYNFLNSGWLFDYMF